MSLLLGFLALLCGVILTAQIGSNALLGKLLGDYYIPAAVNMLMPGPAWGQHEIELRHRTFLALDDGERTFALENEANGVHRMAMRPREFAGEQNLQAGVQSLCRGGASSGAQLGIGEHQHAAFHIGG